MFPRLRRFQCDIVLDLEDLTAIKSIARRKGGNFFSYNPRIELDRKYFSLQSAEN